MLIRDKYGHEYEYDGGILPDGARMTVPLVMMDSTQRAIARAGTRARTTVVDAFGNSDDFALGRPGFRYPTRRTTADVARQMAYDEANEAAEEAWRTPPAKPLPAGAYPTNGARVGDICTINGAPGHLRDRDGGLVCVPDEQHDSQRFDDREAAYAQRALDDENAWRNAK
jgi:hypothetical protein